MNLHLVLLTLSNLFATFYLLEKNKKKKNKGSAGAAAAAAVMTAAAASLMSAGAASATPSPSNFFEESAIEGSATEKKTLLEENRALKDQRMCKVCMDAEVNIVFLPCGHLVCCSNCAPALRNCAVCRELIRGTVRTYLS